jgi:nucleoside phosphorylase
LEQGRGPDASNHHFVKSRAFRLFAAALMCALVPPVAAQAMSPPAGPGPREASCPVLVLSAMPVELGPLLARANVNPNPVWVADGRGFWAGSLEGNRVVMALSGIGLVNATTTTDDAFSHFGCFSEVVFSGTSGGDYIGDVMVPARWTLDGKTFVATSPAALDVLEQALRRPVALEQTTPAGDPFCICGITPTAPSATTPVTVEHKPTVEVGGDGLSSDGFGTRALPCSPAVNDVFGCWPCPFPDTAAATQATNLATTVPPFVDPSFVTGYEAASTPPPGNYVSEDMETAAVFSIAAAHHVPFIGFRAASDGGGDPLMLPGFPAEFFVYRQLAADNAAAVALAFLQAWAVRRP